MKSKKLLAMLIAVAMIFSLSMTVFASTAPEEFGDFDEDLKGTGELLGITHTYDIVVPTSEMFDFYLDPFGLLGAIDEDGDALDNISLADLEEYAGKILSKNGPAAIINLSSLPVVVEVGLTFNSDDLVVVTDKADIAEDDEDDDYNALLYVVPALDAITDSNTLLDAPLDEDVDVTAEYVASEFGYAIPDDGGALTFLLEAAPFHITGNLATGLSLEIDEEGIGFGTALKIGGWLNTQADWLTWDGDAELEVVLTFKTVKEAKEDGIDVAPSAAIGPYGLIFVEDLETVEHDFDGDDDGDGSTGGGPKAKPSYTGSGITGLVAETWVTVTDLNLGGYSTSDLAKVYVTVGAGPVAVTKDSASGNGWQIQGSNIQIRSVGATGRTFQLVFNTTDGEHVVLVPVNGGATSSNFYTP